MRHEIQKIQRSSVTEYLTFIASTGENGVNVIYADENIWLSQKMMAELYNINVRTVSDHLKKIFSDDELDPNSVIRDFRITASDGKNYRIVQDKLFESDFDKLIKNEKLRIEN